MIKLIVTDMDGTLLHKDGSLPRDFYDVYNKLKEKGIIFAIASGRQYHTLLNNFKKLNDNISVIAENGAIFIHEGKEVFSLSIGRQKALELLQDIKKLDNCDVVLCCKNYAYVEDKKPKFVEEVAKYYHNCISIKNILDFPEDEVLKIAIYDYVDANICKDKLYDKWGRGFQLIVSGKNWLDIGRLDVDKGTALEMLQNHFNVKETETLVFGDYFNDVPMFKKAKYSFAMENAPDGVKKHAAFIADNNENNGVIKKVKELILDNKS